jgi:hypothetical protein
MCAHAASYSTQVHAHVEGGKAGELLSARLPDSTASQNEPIIWTAPRHDLVVSAPSRIKPEGARQCLNRPSIELGNLGHDGRGESW